MKRTVLWIRSDEALLGVEEDVRALGRSPATEFGRFAATELAGAYAAVASQAVSENADRCVARSLAAATYPLAAPRSSLPRA